MPDSITRPQESEYSPFFEKYVSKIEGELTLDFLSQQPGRLANLLEPVSEDSSLFRYQEGKWSIRECIGHMIETERVFVYRALRASRNDKTDMRGFDQDEFVQSASHDEISLENHLEELKALRVSTTFFVKNLAESSMENSGVSSGHNLSCRASLFIIAGHFEHHIPLLKDLYISKLF